MDFFRSSRPEKAQESTCARVSFFNKLQASGLQTDISPPIALLFSQITFLTSFVDIDWKVKLRAELHFLWMLFMLGCFLCRLIILSILAKPWMETGSDPPNDPNQGCQEWIQNDYLNVFAIFLFFNNNSSFSPSIISVSALPCLFVN